MDKVEKIRSDYPKGTRIVLIHMDDPYTKLTEGSIGTVSHVDDMGTIHMKWDSGSTLGLIIGVDQFKQIKEEP